MNKLCEKQTSTNNRFLSKVIDIAEKYNLDLFRYICNDTFKLRELIDDLFKMGVIDEQVYLEYHEIFQNR